MKTIILITIIILFSADTFSQTPCTKVTANETPGVWRKQADDDLAMADNSFPKAEYRSVLPKAQKVIELLKMANPTLKGVDGQAHRGIRGDSYFPKGPLKFAVYAWFYGYFCVPDNSGYLPEARGKVQPGRGFGPIINFYFNNFGWAMEEIHSEGDLLTAEGEALFFLPKQLGEFKGMPLIQPESAGTSGKQEAVIITPNSRLPYKPVTREQFIQARIKNYRDYYRKDERSSFEPKIAELNLLLDKMSPAERQAQAITKNPFVTDERLFTTEANGGKRVVAVDKGFFNPGLPRTTIQFITVYWKPAVSPTIMNFKQNFDFEALKQMLGK